jgi:hypothetical protein
MEIDDTTDAINCAISALEADHACTDAAAESLLAGKQR